MKKNTVKSNKRIQKIHANVVETKTKQKFQIHKDLVPGNYAEIVAKRILEKALINAFIEIKIKYILPFVGIFSYNLLLKDIKIYLSLLYICYEKENTLPFENTFNDNYLRYEPSWDECNIPQPNPPKLDRWKIYHLNVVKSNNSINSTTIPKLDEKNKSKGIRKFIKSKSVLGENIRINNTKSLTSTQRDDINYEYLEAKKKARMQIMALNLFDSFPSFPLDENLFKIKINISKKEEEQIGILREEILVKEEIKRKKEEKIKKFQLLRQAEQEKDGKEMVSEGKSKFKNKNIGVTTNGEIIFIQSVNVNNLKSEFLQMPSKMISKSEDSKTNSLQNKISYKNKLDKKEIEIEKNKEKPDWEDLFKENNNSSRNKQAVIGGFSFKNFVPEVGVNLKQGSYFKSGGNDFAQKYKKTTYEQFEKTLNAFKEANIANNELLKTKEDKDNMSSSKSRNTDKIKPNLPMKSNTLYSFNLVKNGKDSKKYLKRNSTLPDILKTNITQNKNDTNNNNNTNNNNDLNIKHPFNFTIYNNNFNYNKKKNKINNGNAIMNSTGYNYNHKNSDNLIKTSSSFKDIMFNPEGKNKNIKINNELSNTSTNFFFDFNKKYKILSRPKHNNISLKKFQFFNNDLENDNFIGLSSQENNAKEGNKIPFINIIKKNVGKNILRVRSNQNEIYNKKLDMRDRLTLRKIEDEINIYKTISQRNQHKKIKSMK